AYARDFGGIGTAPISIAVSEALQRCATVAEAAEWISSRPRWGGGILMMADADGDIASLELSNTRSQVRRPKGDRDVLFHTNAFSTRTMQSVEVPQNPPYTNLAPPSLPGRRVHESAKVRDLRFKERLKGDEPLGPDQLARIMADHETAGQ